MKNYYKILQVDSAAEPEIITVAYKRLALKYHPDTNMSSNSTSRMQEINEAYQVLKDSHKRSEYDQQLSADIRNNQQEYTWTPKQPNDNHRDTQKSEERSQQKSSTPESARNTKIKVYKRYSSPHTITEAVAQKPGYNGQLIFVVGEVIGELNTFQCPWCNQSYEISSMSKNVFFKCAKCQNIVYVTHE